MVKYWPGQPVEAYGYGFATYLGRLPKWKDSADPENLTRDDLVRILTTS